MIFEDGQIFMVLY